MTDYSVDRRTFIRGTAGTTAYLLAGGRLRAASFPFRPRYILASAMYGTTPLDVVLGEAAGTGAAHIDIWPRIHANHLEQIVEMGYEEFSALLEKHQVKLGAVACYRFGPFRLGDQLQWIQQIGARDVVLVCGGRGPRDVKGEALKAAVKEFVEQMKPHDAAATEAGCVIAIENHANNLVFSPDSLKWLAEFAEPLHSLGIAFAPHHLHPRNGHEQARLIETLGPAIRFFYAQQYGKGSHHEQPREDELLQMPGRGPLDFQPMIGALKRIGYAGFIEIFMHPYPRGIPIRESIEGVSEEINRSRRYLDECIQKINAV